MAVFDLRTDHDHDRREERSPEQISGRALLLGHGLDEEHERREEEQHDLELALVREPVVAVLDVGVEVHHDVLRDHRDEEADDDLRRRAVVDEDQQARERQPPHALIHHK